MLCTVGIAHAGTRLSAVSTLSADPVVYVRCLLMQLPTDVSSALFMVIYTSSHLDESNAHQVWLQN